ncbi:MAG TPA: GIY-YIG nuclease family protein [Candidatus Babeliales bacterium]|nr:GIY-YIG nuclease family protein [Candidatus Babeliales bacterium]
MVKDKLASLPTYSGIYIFKDIHNQIIYIGKAKSLKSRVTSYFNKTDNFKTQTLAAEIHDIDYIPTKNEDEALLLEAELIKEHQPKFNILLKDGQPFIYLTITKGAIPEFKVVRSKVAKATHFGPFINKTQARQVHRFLSEKFNVQLCNKKIPNGCLRYHIGICAGNCRDKFDLDEHLLRIDLIKKILQEKYSEFEDVIRKQIEEYNKEFLFEKSKKLSEYLDNLEYIIKVTKLHFNRDKFEPFIAMVKDKSQQRLIPNKGLAKALKEAFKLSIEPHTIDCFDISHFQSHFIVGSCIRFVDGVPAKNMFRRFKIKTLDQQDDYAALAEIVQRRYKSKNFPDLILIDGGKGQLNAIKPLFNNVDCISLAKREERIFCEAYPQGKVLDIHTETGKLLIALRDYAHHFAISYHRKRRSNSM